MQLRATPKHVQRSRWAALPLALLLATGCGPSHGQAASAGADANEPSRRPSVKDMLEATAPGYQSPAGVGHDCLGRLVFDVPAPVQWPTFYDPDSASPFHRSFSARVADRADVLHFGKTLIGVIGPANAALVKDVLKLTPMIYIDELKGRIKEKQADIAALKKAGAKAAGSAGDLQAAQERIAEWEASIKQEQDTYEKFDAGLPDSVGYWTQKALTPDPSKQYSIYRAYLMRGQYIYVFEDSREMIKAGDKDEHKKDVVALLNKFRVRKANEIPAELGVCVPHGFIADDGKTVIDFKQSLRWADAPGVLYTIQTGNVQPRKLKSTTVIAAARASVGMLGSTEEEQVKPLVTQRVGPRPYKIGGLVSEQGGVALTFNQGTKTQHEAYSVFTGYSGWLGTAVLPFILVDMNTLTMAQAPELKTNPPPFKQSMGRLELLLKSLRLRPTNPPMPELAGKH